MSDQADTLVATGAWGTVRYAVRLDGSMPAKAFFDACDCSDQAKLIALFKRMAEAGKISNRTKFKQVEGEIFEFKSFQARVSCYRNGSFWILLHGFVKKQDRWPPGQLKHAELVLREDRQREQKKTGERHA